VLQISDRLFIPETEIDISAIRASGPGGQNVNKVSSAVHLRFDIRASSLPQWVKQQLLNCADRRITADGVVIIKAQRRRTREQNREDALQRLRELVAAACATPRPRRATRPSRASRQKRMDSKTHRGRVKTLRGKPEL